MTQSQAYAFILLTPVLVTVIAYFTWHTLEFIMKYVHRIYWNLTKKRRHKKWKEDLKRNDIEQYLHGRTFDK